jgi:hypothetical protein
MTTAKLILKSSNSKLGNVSATYASIEGSCPKDCALKDNGCYAQLSFVGIHTRRLETETPKATALEEARQIKKAIKEELNTRPLRLHVAGDCRTDVAAKLLGDSVKEWNGPVWTYTHAWKDVKRSSWGKHVSVLASVDDPGQLNYARNRGYAAAVVVSKFPSVKAFPFHGFKAIPCPAQTHDDVTCESCKLCWNDKRLKQGGFVIAFEAHGVRRRSLPVVK